MDSPLPSSGARAAAEEIVPLPTLPVLWGARRLKKQIDSRRFTAEQIIRRHCLDRSLGKKALDALSAEARRLAVTGRSIPHDMAEAITALEQALGVERAK
jgi:hypothetical protein